MGLAEALARDVSERTRTKGNRYFLGGAVRAIEGTDSEVVGHGARDRSGIGCAARARATGFSPPASVRISADRQDFCKHIWAVVLAADAEGLLLGDPAHRGRVPRAAIRGRPGPPATTTSAPPPSAPRPHEAVAAVPAVGSAARQRAHGRRTRAGMRRASSCMCSSGSRTSSSVPTVQVHWRTRKKNGEWGKPQPAALGAGRHRQPRRRGRPRRSCRCCSARRIRSCSGCNMCSVATRASFRIAGPLIERVLPSIAQSGRLFLRDADLRATDLIAAGLGRRAAVVVQSRRPTSCRTSASRSTAR